ncbi:ABC transporter permease [Paenibacillus sp. S150]|uniref:ABC transporter permease n=1 Tax=Paenibacillus sp. S150 TaxID=2749826 RepID=UPI001C58E1DF|nr:ABC transporter permease [Paenibacillus sp. S150]MBW4079825.1 ABC transporter permease [Paenibacillus sp. S150]
MSVEGSRAGTPQKKAILLRTSPARKRRISRRDNRTRLNDYMAGAIVPVSLVVLWQAACSAGLVSGELLPSPVAIINAFLGLLGSGEFYSDLQTSLVRVLSGFLIGGVLGLLFGIAAGMFRPFEHALDPTVQMIRMIPHLAVAPLILIWFGFGETSKILIIAKGTFFPLYINTFLGIRSADSKLLEVSRILQFSRFKQISLLILPASLPHILLGIRIAFGLAWIGLFIAEMIGSNAGIGFIILRAQQTMDAPLLFAGVLLFALVGLLTDLLVRMMEIKWLKWRDSYQG